MSQIFPIRIVSTQESNTLHVRFFPTDICNFSCSYCFPGSGNIGKYRYPKNVGTVIKNFKILFDMYINNLNKNKFDLFLAGGGEPTMWPGIEEFCRGIKEKHDVYTTIITNGSRTLRWWEENCEFFDGVTLSCHHEFVDIDHYIQVADLLYSRGVKVNGLMLMDAQHWDKCVSYVEKMKNSQYPWFIQTKEIVDSPGKGMDAYTPEQIAYINNSLKRLPDSDWLLKHLDILRAHESLALLNDGTAFPAMSQSIVVNKWNNFKGWHCNVALESLMINYDGSVTGSCQEPIFKDINVNLFSETFEQDFQPLIDFKSISCSRDWCTCQPETHITKFKP
jgi:MoaA/NifB/PqqE/SkfB family radical SAM enzyme